MAQKPTPIGPRDAMGGREVQAPPMKEWERANPASISSSLQVGPWKAPPRPPEGIPSRDLVDYDKLQQTNPEQYRPREQEYRKGGKVRNFCKGGKVISSRNM